VPAQKVTGGFMELKSDRPTALVGATSPMAGVVEIHEMRMDGDMARMRQISRLEIGSAQTVKLQPGGYHLMLMDLKQPLKAGEYIPIKLRFESAGKAMQEIEVKAQVRALDSHHH
ncbi:MAG TPA: copper chaperone PCu(A)C, partial [Burkholderiales bacterium]|nr:copper chaperone PCu(A)C [Burkholderiales bacterium]